MRNLRLASWALASGVALWSFSGVAMAERRVALVVGNSDYLHNSDLANPKNDATAVAKALRDLRFEVIKGEDITYLQFKEILWEFQKKTKEEGVAMFFYAGHGAQYKGHNYLVPSDAKLAKESDYKDWHISLDEIIDMMKSNTKIVILDACRNNPLEARLTEPPTKRRGDAKSRSRGLARVKTKSEKSTFIAYAAAEGDTAEDGKGRNSPFTEALLRYIRQDKSLADIFSQVSVDVKKKTREDQIPWVASEGASIHLARIEPPPPSSDPGVYLKFGVGAGQKIEEAHLEVAAEGRISENEVRNYSMVRGGCYSQGISARTRLEWRHIGLCTR